MHPAVVLLADGGDVLDGVEGAEDRSARRAVDEEGDVALGLALQDQPLELGRNHAATARSKSIPELSGYYVTRRRTLSGGFAAPAFGIVLVGIQ